MNTILAALGLGDEGKGAWCEYFADKTNANLSVRYNGGCQSARYVHHKGVAHQSQQFSAASLVRPRLKTLVLDNVPVNPDALIREAQALEELGLDALRRFIITYTNPVITPAHNFLCQLRESLSENPIGTTGIGVRELMADIAAGNEAHILRVCDLLRPDFEDKLSRIIEYQLVKTRALDAPCEMLEYEISEYFQRNPTDELTERYKQFASSVGEIISPPGKNRLLHRKNIIFEPAQGFWLDRQYGTIPYVTSTDTTTQPLGRLRIAGDTEIVGLTRAFAVRHGPGPLPTETTELSGADNNIFTKHQGNLRYGWLDLHMVKEAWNTNLSFFYPPDARLSLAVSHLDELSGLEQIPVAYGRNCDGSPQYSYLRGWQTDISGVRSSDALPEAAKQYLDFIQTIVGAPVRYVSVGPTIEHRFEIAL